MTRFMAVMHEVIGALYPLSREDYLSLFGTAYPTRHDIAQAASVLATVYKRIERGSGIYLILYQNDVPTEIYFMGISGD
jgi:hypothetical protein